MKPADSILIGYYGRSNFGDDVLMVVTHDVARQSYPDHRIAVRTGTKVDYVERFLGVDVQQIPFGTRDRHRMIMHGGGGTFFDFTPHGAIDKLLNQLMFAGGTRNYVRLEAALRRLAGRPRMSADVRLGMGIGVGTFAPGSRKLRESLPILCDFDALWVRDPGSVSNLKNIGATSSVVLGSDLAFLWERWCPPSLALQPVRKLGSKPRIGVILRDWPTGGDPTFAATIKPSLEAIRSRFDLHLFSLDASADAATLSWFDDFPQTVWRPESMTISEFAAGLASQDAFLTSRAHGAICGACLGRPSVILEIEPKLGAVHAMLPNCTSLVPPHPGADVLEQYIDDALAVPIDRIAADVAHNRTLSERALAGVLAGALA